MRRASLIGVTFGALMVVLSGQALCQDIVIDWATKNIIASPTEIHKGDTAKVSVQNVNDILYDYTVDVQLQIQNNSDDLAQLLKLLPSLGVTGSAQAATPDCKGMLGRTQKIMGNIGDKLKDPKNNLDPSAQPGKPISLADTLKGWHDSILGILPDLQKSIDDLSSKCSSDTDVTTFLSGPYHQFDSMRKKVEGQHEATGQATASSGDVASLTVTVTEKSGATTLTTITKTIQFSSVLTLSGGVLLSTLEDRSYVASTVPTSTGTQNILTVQGGHTPVPMLVGLLNYKLPWLDWEKAGFAVSTGPVLRVGGQSTTTSFGWFVGGSAHIWHRFYVTPGVHVGQFADFPAGFGPNQVIPPNFGQLTPVKRCTSRFAVGITVKTFDLGSLTPSKAKTPASPQNGGTGTQPSGSPKTKSQKKPKNP